LEDKLNNYFKVIIGVIILFVIIFAFIGIRGIIKINSAKKSDYYEYVTITNIISLNRSFSKTVTLVSKFDGKEYRTHIFKLLFDSYPGEQVKIMFNNKRDFFIILDYIKGYYALSLISIGFSILMILALLYILLGIKNGYEMDFRLFNVWFISILSFIAATALQFYEIRNIHRTNELVKSNKVEEAKIVRIYELPRGNKIIVYFVLKINESEYKLAYEKKSFTGHMNEDIDVVFSKDRNYWTIPKYANISIGNSIKIILWSFIFWLIIIIVWVFYVFIR
jgi:hypothetical protein